MMRGRGRAAPQSRAGRRGDPWQDGQDPWRQYSDDPPEEGAGDDSDEDGSEQPPDQRSRLYRSTDGTCQHVYFIRLAGDKNAKVQFVDTGRVVTVRRNKLGEFDADMVGCCHFMGEGEAGSDSGGTITTSKTSTSRLTTTSAAAASKVSDKGSGKGKYRGGTAPMPPTNNGAVPFRTYRIDVRVWKKLATPYMPPAEMALRLWRALEGKLKEQLREINIDELEAEDGVEVLLDKIKDLTGDLDMVELGDDMDNFFDKTRRRVGESLRDYVHRFEVNYQKLANAGEALTIKAQANRILKYSCLSHKEQRELLQNSGGDFNIEKIKGTMRMYSQYYGLAKPPPGAGHQGSYGNRHNVNMTGQPAAAAEGELADQHHELENATTADYSAAAAADEEHGDPLSGGFAQEMMDEDDYEGLPDELVAEIHQANMIINDGKKKLRNAQQLRKTVNSKIRRKETPEERNKRLAAAKKVTKCSDCDELGHWHGDPERKFTKKAADQAQAVSHPLALQALINRREVLQA